ncbi:helix-turn-helix transcriptional regulator [Kribbella shirazensis]|jgi:transcriptional regulator with XRE-family HTH domain|uniref:Transcriptional regulator with XRE-family HTH domain n=1 Tax=Kribbella shirazensis TaxID=1105143 RepID=A0A7X5V7L6_9ACTN|nr:helix-turn-helix transcriptional regulator [Kribbella shirazensis]NIK56115.1 transcriptional regulator with XRE-family HTH domain [Kribbella shirazensis]
MEYADLSDFLRKRREALQPEDVGMPRGRRRRTPGLRREEVAALASMSADYYSRLEGGRGPQPSVDMLGSIARALRLTLEERDHLFLLAGHGTPPRTTRACHVDPGMLRILDRLHDTPAMLINRCGEVLAQTPAHVAFAGELTNFEGMERSEVYRWFAHPESRALYAEPELSTHSRLQVSMLRTVATIDGPKSYAASIVRALQKLSPEFTAIWDAHEVVAAHSRTKRFRHPVVGELELYCELIDNRDQQQTLIVFTATPGSESAEKLELLAVLGSQTLDPAR